ncbi:MAG: PAS domain S-box protein, partial [Methanobacteriaceae archaeon]|nr:PAS domain S-box protein [Methanobacteriaceae archaeon]
MSAAKILIVEDEGLTAMELQRKLRYWGYEVPSFVFSGREAIKKVKEINPDLIIMDIVLKGEIDGIDAAKEIIKSSQAPIIYLTAHGDNKTYERAMMTKHAAYILKPYDESELHRVIETAIYKNNLTKKLEKRGKSVDESLNNSRGVIITDQDGYVQYINWEASKLTGWKKEQALNKNLKEILKIEDLNSKILLNNINYSQEIVESSIGYSKLISTDKTVREIEYNIEPIKDDHGDFLGYTIIFQDITDIKLSNELNFISESDKQFQSIYSHSPIPSGLFNSSGKLVDVNQSFMGLIREDDISKIKEMNLFDILNFSSKDKNDLNKGKTIEYEINSESKNINFNLKEKTNNLKIIINPLFLDEDLIGGYLIQMQDISNEKIHEKSSKKSENNYKQLFNNINDIFIELDSEMNVLFWNKAAEELTRIDSKHALGEHVFKLLPNLKDSELMEIFDKALKNNEIGTVVKKSPFKGEDLYLKVESYPSEKGLSVIIKDFTDFEKDKEDLKKIKGFYRNLVDEQNDIILRYTLDGNIIYANQICLKSFGTDIVGKDILSIVIPEDRNIFKNHLESIKNDKNFKNIQTKILNLEDQVFIVDWAFNPVKVNGDDFSEIQAVGRNINQIIESKQNLVQKNKKQKKDFEFEIKKLNDLKESLKVEIHKLENIRNDLTNENLKLKSD